jgi:hypothetical protein
VKTRVGSVANNWFTRCATCYCPRLPCADDHAPIQVLQWHHQLAGDPARLVGRRREALAHGGTHSGSTPSFSVTWVTIVIMRMLS